jgi:putative N-acetyltransferase (TIGR04045 family)
MRRMMPDAVRPFTAPGFQIKYAVEPWERAGAAALRRRVFCREQGLFGEDDRDAIDEFAIPIVALAHWGVYADAVVGTVRIHEEAPGLWWGSRLAVCKDHRRVGALGSALIRLAVCSANARGCTRFLAHVQSQNVLLFRRLRWTTIEEVELHGRLHHRMEADLAHYPPFHSPQTGFLALRAAA